MGAGGGVEWGKGSLVLLYSVCTIITSQSLRHKGL